MALSHLVLLVVVVAATSASAFNITTLLSQSPDFSTFNSFLSQTHLADEINRRQTITILALDNSAVSTITSRPLDVAKDILAVHVILDYYDVDKLQKLPKKTRELTTLFQTTGRALGKMGFLNATVQQDGSVAIGSAQPGAPLDAKVVKLVLSSPYNISVLQVSMAIVPQGIENVNHTSTAAPPAPVPVPAASPADAPSKAPAPAASPSGTDASAPSPSSDADAPASGSPAESPANGSPADAPASSPAAADAPAADAPGPNADAADDKASGCRVGFNGRTAAAVAVGAMVLLASM